VSDDPRRLRPDHHPTPFSAAEIRDAFEVGREVRSLTVRAGAEPYILVRRNLSADHVSGVYEVWTESTDGVRLSEPEQGRSTWLELQGHASMPADATTIDTVEIDLPMGRYQGLRYTRVTGDAVDTFWFALSLPGAPVQMESRVGGQVVLSLTTIAQGRPPKGPAP